MMLLALLVGCATTSPYTVRYCKDGREVQVLRPVVSNAALNRFLLEQRTREACSDRR